LPAHPAGERSGPHHDGPRGFRTRLASPASRDACLRRSPAVNGRVGMGEAKVSPIWVRSPTSVDEGTGSCPPCTMEVIRFARRTRLRLRPVMSSRMPAFTSLSTTRPAPFCVRPNSLATDVMVTGPAWRTGLLWSLDVKNLWSPVRHGFPASHSRRELAQAARSEAYGRTKGPQVAPGALPLPFWIVDRPEPAASARRSERAIRSTRRSGCSRAARTRSSS
jgi:hypothetical protein